MSKKSWKKLIQDIYDTVRLSDFNNLNSTYRETIGNYSEITKG